MNDLALNGGVIEAELRILASLCKKGDCSAAGAVAFCGARCAELLHELQNLPDLQPGKEAVEMAARRSSEWPIAFPSVEDGRTNRIQEQAPAMLGVDLGIRLKKLPGTGRRQEKRPGVRTFLEDALQQPDRGFITNGSERSKAAIMASLIALDRFCKAGEHEAASMVATLGVRFADLLFGFMQSRNATPERRALNAAARLAPEWPVVFRAREGGRANKIEDQVPSMLGEGMGFRTNKHAGTKADRDFDSGARVGFASEYRDLLDRGRRLAEKYQNWNAAHFGEILGQAIAAGSVLRQPGFKLDLSKIRETDPATVELIGNDLISVVPGELKGIWRSLSKLPDFKKNTVEIWTRAAMELAKAQCGGDWVNGPWPDKLKSDAVVRMDENCSDKYAFREAVELWMKYGFSQLVDG
jgi:hypothetical protein